VGQRAIGLVCILVVPFLLIGLEIVRHRQWLRHRHEKIVPGTQDWCMVVTLVGYALLGLGVVLIATG
jgi:hypothetical protein